MNPAMTQTARRVMAFNIEVNAGANIIALCDSPVFGDPEVTEIRRQAVALVAYLSQIEGKSKRQWGDIKRESDVIQKRKEANETLKEV